jgi:hypothetical protein
MTGFAKSRRSPLVAFLRFQRAVPLRATLSTCRVCFAPATLLSFRLQGFEPPGEETAFPQPFLPCRFTRTRTGLTTSEVWTLREAGPNRRSAPIPCLLDVLPSGALPPAAAASGFPGASSHVLGSHLADDRDRSHDRQSAARSGTSESCRTAGPVASSTHSKARLTGTGPSGVCCRSVTEFRRTQH